MFVLRFCLGIFSALRIGKKLVYLFDENYNLHQEKKTSEKLLYFVFNQALKKVKVTTHDANLMQWFFEGMLRNIFFLLNVE